MTRNLSLIDALLPSARRRILSTLLLAPDRAWYLSDLARFHGTTPSSLQRELASLVGAGILTKAQDGNRTYFRADVGCPVFPELQGLLKKTAGLVDLVKEALAPLGPMIQTATIFGSVAARSETSASDVDILVVGRVQLLDLANTLRPLESRLSRAVNPLLYSVDEFRDKVRTGHHFLTSVLAEPMLFIIGSGDDLARLAEGGAGERPHHVQIGDQRPPRGH